MNEQPPVLNREKVDTLARIIHGAVAGGLVIAFAVFLYLRSQLAIELPQAGVQGLRLVGYVMLGTAILVAQMLRGRIKPAGQAVDISGWWTKNLPRAVIVWAVAEGGSLGAIVVGWVIGDTTLLAVGVAVGLALLFVSRPSRLERII
ncbi:MAG: hypothetical protein GTO46_07240 [Gemmatimonadetes bacterium]|nr:hypothetical protein [Gemmatimonadota bacterium]NIO31425.1 hypothetical protein [Gemmatimonadota bacterium]